MSKAKELLPLPLTPVKTVRVFLGISRLTFFKLCSDAPTTTIWSFPCDIKTRKVLKDGMFEVKVRFVYLPSIMTVIFLSNKTELDEKVY